MSKKPNGSSTLPPSRSQQILDELKLLIDVEVASATDDVDRFRWNYLREEVLSKFIGPDTDSADLRRQRAIEKWLNVELRNSRTNIRLYSSSTRFKYPSPSGGFTYIDSEDVLELARRIVHRVIGDDPPTEAIGNFSSGASTSLRNAPGNVARKFTVQAHVTRSAWSYILPQLLGCSTWMALNPDLLRPEFVAGNVLFTVPKTTVIDRVAAKEPDLNMWAQKRLGDCIRERLRLFGIDLNDQSRNQRLAYFGSAKVNTLATLDLSSASDSMTSALVGRLLPPGWFVELNALRSESTLIDDVWHENQMFSSMGNGFTFELESLLFYSITRAVCTITGAKGRVSVYGDDIIAPTSVSSLLRDVLGYCGFVVNPKKSHYLRGDLFRESCGAHYYAGYDVKPFYIKDPLSDQTDLIHFLNSFRSWIDVEPFCHTVSNLVRETWWKWAKLVDRRVYGGRDPTSKGRLVTPHSPGWEWKLTRIRKESLERMLQTGLYLQRLRAVSTSASISLNPQLEPSLDKMEITQELTEWKLRKQPLPYWLKVSHPVPRW